MSTTGCFKYCPNAVKVTREKYEEEFKPLAFFSKCYSAKSTADISSSVKYRLQCLHESFLSAPAGLKVLDYGTGPVILSTISAATKASEIVLADYTYSSLKCLQQWLNDEPEALDWSPHFSYVVQELEGKEEQEVAKRQKKVRQLVKAVVHCDINESPAIEKGFDYPYDIVMSSLVLDATASTEADYHSSVSRLAQLVKPGGSLFYYGVKNKQGFYTVGERNFPSLFVSDESAVKAFRDAGFSNGNVSHAPDILPGKSFRFIKGTHV